VVFSKLWPRLRQNYLMPDRLDEYRLLLTGIRHRGYRFLPLVEFANTIRAGNTTNAPTCLLRVDVDSDPRGAGRMFAVERELGIRSTYYFRLSTIDRALIAEMVQHGTEIGYHFEEASTLARQRGYRSAADVEDAREELRAQFRANVAKFHERTGVTPRTVAAHGDFLNRRLGVSNNCFVDRALLDELEISAEAYERWLVSHISARIADRPAPRHWHPYPPEVALASNPAVVSLIVHPRQWVRHSSSNARADWERVWAEAEYGLNRWRRRVTGAG